MMSNSIFDDVKQYVLGVEANKSVKIIALLKKLLRLGKKETKFLCFALDFS